MPDQAKTSLGSTVAKSDVLPGDLWLAASEQHAKTLELLYEVSREITSILDREELLSRIAQLVKKLVDYHVFTVMLWDESKQHLESVFFMRYDLYVPLLLRDRLGGVLDLESTEPDSFTAEHERMLTLLGSYISIALENARLYELARENERRLQADLETAREIQQQLLP